MILKLKYSNNRVRIPECQRLHSRVNRLDHDYNYGTRLKEIGQTMFKCIFYEEENENKKLNVYM